MLDQVANNARIYGEQFHTCGDSFLFNRLLCCRTCLQTMIPPLTSVWPRPSACFRASTESFPASMAKARMPRYVCTGMFRHAQMAKDSRQVGVVLGHMGQDRCGLLGQEKWGCGRSQSGFGVRLGVCFGFFVVFLNFLVALGYVLFCLFYLFF